MEEVSDYRIEVGAEVPAQAAQVTIVIAYMSYTKKMTLVFLHMSEEILHFSLIDHTSFLYNMERWMAWPEDEPKK